MRISFVLPLPNEKPVGGFRVVYEYADRLAGRGHEVTVYYPVQVPVLKYARPYWFRYLKSRMMGDGIAGWFAFKNRVLLRIIPRISERHIDDGDAVVATAVPTAYEIDGLSAAKGRKLYLIQHYEIWDGVALAHESYKLGLKNVVVSKWLKEKIEETGAEVAGVLPNSIDFYRFRTVTDPRERDRFYAASIFHHDESKGSKDALEALGIARRSHQQLRAVMFSVFRKPEWFPDWVEFVYNPTQGEIVRILNRASIFVSSSITEGFGLPGMEALACGCSLVTTDSLGVREYAIHDRTALLSKPRAPEELAKNIISLIEDEPRRIKLAEEGGRYIKRFSWDDNAAMLEKLLQDG